MGVYDVVVKKFTFALSSPDKFSLTEGTIQRAAITMGIGPHSSSCLCMKYIWNR